MANWKSVMSHTDIKLQPDQIKTWEGKSKSGALEYDNYTTSSSFLERSGTSLKDKIEKYVASKKNQCGCDCCDNTEEKDLKEIIDKIRENLDMITSSSTANEKSSYEKMKKILGTIISTSTEESTSSSAKKNISEWLKKLLEAIKATSTEETVSSSEETTSTSEGTASTSAEKSISEWMEKILDAIITTSTDEKDRAEKMKSLLEAIVSYYKDSDATDKTALDKLKEVVDKLIASSTTNAENECCCDSNSKSNIPSFFKKMFSTIIGVPKTILKAVT